MIELKENNMIDENKLDKREVLLFLRLLDDEKDRHIAEGKQAHFLSWLHHDEKLISIFWKCQAENHKKDIKMIDECMLQLVLKWNLIR